MKTGNKEQISREELADTLEEMAAAIRKGTFELAGNSWSVPDALETKFQHKEKKGRIKTRIEWQWSTLDEYESAAREAVKSWKQSFKNAKKRLGRTFKAMRKAVEEGRIPTDDLLEAFVQDSTYMNDVADPEWKEAMEEYLDHLANLEAAVARGQRDVVAHELRDLGTCMKTCHREFK